MVKTLPRLAGNWLLWVWLLPGMAAGQVLPAAPDTATRAPRPATPAPAPASLAGLWKGPLPIPGGSLPIQLTILQPGANKLLATLDLPAKRLNRIPASVTFRGDTLVFYAATAECRFACVPSADGQELRGTWTQPGLLVPLVLRRAAEGAAPAVSGSRAGAAPVTTYHIETVTLTSQPGDVRLVGTLSIPDGPGPFPAAALLSDMGPHDRDARQGDYRLFAVLASALARQGIAVLRLDDRGVGESGGAGALATTADLVRDAQAALTYLRLRPSIDPSRTGLIGHGEGGNVALLAAAQPLPPAFVVALAAAGLPGQELLANQPEPTPTPADTARAGAARRRASAEVLSQAAKLRSSGSNAAQVDTYLAQQRLKAKVEERKQADAARKFRRAMLEIVRQNSDDDQAQAIVVNMLRQRYPDGDPAAARARAAQLVTPWYRYYLRFDPQPGLAEVRCPVLLLQGTDDAEVNAAANLLVLEKGLKGNKRVTARRLPGVNHLFQAPTDEPATPGLAPGLVDTVRDWVLLEAEE
ncbi:alpha/beta fold hydrolase [Hymenobacter sp.]|uniref:alpha/beta hydrolase family protein n=1 Tax=Hymenobacter sp. TaxID=1898978 RepID=UPI00286B454D|nr:alpha/beta fold hydrolase [Hymenobacter sp.]